MNAPNEASTGRVKLLLAALKAELGDDEELLKQAFEDSNALERQGQRIFFESRIDTGANSVRPFSPEKPR